MQIMNGLGKSTPRFHFSSSPQLVMMDLFTQWTLSFFICVLVALLTIYYFYLTWNFDYWEKQGVPGPKPVVFIGTFFPVWRQKLENQDVENGKKYGRLYGGFENRKPALFTTDPELIKQIAVKDFAAFPNRRKFAIFEKEKYLNKMLTLLEGDEWKTVRNTLSPSYTTGKLKLMMGLIEECINDLSSSLQEAMEREQSVEMSNYFTVLTLDVIASCAFGMKVDCIKNGQSEFVSRAKKVFRLDPKVAYCIIIFGNILKYMKYLPVTIIPNPFKYFQDFAIKMVDMRLKNKQTGRKDFLEIMLNAEIQDNKNTTEEDQSKKTLSRETIVSQTILFLLAGHETTASTLTFMSYELAVNPKIQEKLIEEIDEIMEVNKGVLTYEALAGMQYLDMVVSETLRKYPPAVRMERCCEQDNYKIKNAILQNGFMVLIPIYAIHHDPEFYPNPEDFDPERFLPETKAKRNPFTYLPFGAGPRNCIAMRFALMEVKLTIVILLSKFRFMTCENTQIPLQISGGMGLLQTKSVLLQLQKRIY